MSDKAQLDCTERCLYHRCQRRWATCHDLRLDRGLLIHDPHCSGNGRDVFAMAGGWRSILMGSYAGTTTSIPADVVYHWMVYVDWWVVLGSLIRRC